VSRPLRPYEPGAYLEISKAIADLRSARRKLAGAGAKRAAAAVARALKSVEGAQRHAGRIVDNASGAEARAGDVLCVCERWESQEMQSPDLVCGQCGGAMRAVS
jgi:hypothetical protein